MDGAQPDGAGDAQAIVSQDAAAPDAPAADASPELPADSSVSPIEEPFCRPFWNGPRWGEEQDALTWTPVCGTGLVLAPHEVQVKDPPPGASWDTARGELRWRPGLDQAGTHVLTLVTSHGELGQLTVSIADAFDHHANLPLVAPQDHTHEFGLPVFHLTITEAFNRDEYTPATVLYGGRVHVAEAKHRGRSSAAYPKRSFTLKFSRSHPFREPEAGITGARKLVLIANFDDNSMLRQRLAFQLWNRMGRGNIPIRHMNAVVYVNGHYEGVYTAADHIDGDLMSEHGLDPNGNLYKAVEHVANFFPVLGGWHGHEKKEGLPEEGMPGAFDDINSLTRFVSESTDEEFREQVGEVLELSDYESWLILATAIQANDTLAKNAYHYHDLRGGGRWRFIPWDFNHSFGQTWQTWREAPSWEVGELAVANNIFVRLMADPVLGERLRERYVAALDDELEVEPFLDLIDRYASEVAANAPRENRRWRDVYQTFSRWSERDDFTTFEEEVAYMRSWWRARWAFLRERYPAL